MNILVAVSRGASTDKVLAAAAKLAGDSSATMHVIHVISDEERTAREQIPGQSRYVDVMMEEAKRDLTGRLVSLQVPNAADAVMVRVGSPVPEIEKVAAEFDHDILVIGMRRRSKVGKFLLGSDLQELLLMSEQPVLAVPTDTLD